MITSVEADDTSPANNHHRIVNELDNAPATTPTRKRTEPEIHYLTNGRPVLFYTPVADTGDNCVAGGNMLMRALAGNLWNN